MTTPSSAADLTAHSESPPLISVCIECEDTLRELYMPFIDGGGLFVPATDALPVIGQSMLLLLELPAIKLREAVLTEVVWVNDPDTNTGSDNPKRGFGLRLRDHRQHLQTVLESELSVRLSDSAPTRTL